MSDMVNLKDVARHMMAPDFAWRPGSRGSYPQAWWHHRARLADRSLAGHGCIAKEGAPILQGAPKHRSKALFLVVSAARKRSSRQGWAQTSDCTARLGRDRATSPRCQALLENAPATRPGTIGTSLHPWRRCRLSPRNGPQCQTRSKPLPPPEMGAIGADLHPSVVLQDHRSRFFRGCLERHHLTGHGRNHRVLLGEPGLQTLQFLL